MDAPHPGGVARSQIVVDGHHVNAPAGEGVEIGGHGGHEGLALTRLHLGDHPPVQCPGTDDLHIEMSLAQHPLGCLPNHCEGLDLQLVEGLPVSQPAAELIRLGAQSLVAHRLE